MYRELIAAVILLLGVDAMPKETPVVCVGVREGQTPVALHGRVSQDSRGTLNLPPGEPWGWITVGPGEKPMPALEGLQSFSVCGWARPIDLRTGSGGNRIAFNLNYDRAGFDLVHLGDGRMRLAVNEWPDGVRTDSSPRKLKPREWTFFAVTYDGTRHERNLSWYFGGREMDATLDRTISHDRGPTGRGSAVLTIGNYNATIHRHGTDRQFRGQLHGIRIFGSTAGAEGALSLDAIRRIQKTPGTMPDFQAPLPAALANARTTPALKSTRQTDAADMKARVPVMPPKGTRPRVIATTDGEIDDRCSMVRFLLYANEWDIEGIVYSSSKFHWDGHDWAGTEWIEKDLSMYESFYPTLSQHAPGIPTAGELRAKTCVGNIRNVGSMERDTPGSDLIVRVLLDPEPGPVFLQAWGGTNTIARALLKIQKDYASRVAEVARKAVIYIILDQDETFREYIEPNWPDLAVLGSFRQFATIAYSWERLIPRELHRYFDAAWMKEHILDGHGPLCARYEVHPQKGFRSEGDSPAFMHQIDVGLRSLEHPGFGGWGGRFVKDERGRNVWRGARDGNDLGKPIWRWAEAFQNDWAARADWCVMDVASANHPPRAVVEGTLDRTVSPGQRVTLSATGSTDPDGDTLSYRWWQYTDVDSVTARLDITSPTAVSGASFVAPDEPGTTIHVILEVTDDGVPPLTRYQRVIFTIAGKD